MATVIFERRFIFDAGPSALRRALEGIATRPESTRWLFKYTLVGPPLRSGSALNCEIRPPLLRPIRIRIDFCECVRPTKIVLGFGGDVEGAGTLDSRSRGRRTELTAAWRVEVKQRPLIALITS